MLYVRQYVKLATTSAHARFLPEALTNGRRLMDLPCREKVKRFY